MKYAIATFDLSDLWSMEFLILLPFCVIGLGLAWRKGVNLSLKDAAIAGGVIFVLFPLLAMGIASWKGEPVSVAAAFLASAVPFVAVGVPAYLCAILFRWMIAWRDALDASREPIRRGDLR